MTTGQSLVPYIYPQQNANLISSTDIIPQVTMESIKKRKTSKEKTQPTTVPQAYKYIVYIIITILMINVSYI